MKVKKIGMTPAGEDIMTYTLTNAAGMRVVVSNFGANLMQIWAPDRAGNFADVLLGYPDAEALQNLDCFFGGLIAPHANRIGGAAYTLDGRTVSLEKNDGDNNLHSGSIGLHKRIWDVTFNEADHSITLIIVSPDGEFGFPGELVLSVTYTLTEDNRLMIDYEARTDAPTPFNPTNHAYFNLSGHDSGDILDHVLTIDADAITWADAASIPDGRFIEVEGTPMDFRTPHRIGDRIDDDYEQLKWAGGYDHNWVLNHESGHMDCVAVLFDPASGRKMEVYTDLPGIQFYSGNFIETGMAGKDGASYPKRAGLCLETQYFPNALNVSAFEQPVLRPGDTAHTTTIYAFSAE